MIPAYLERERKAEEQERREEKRRAYINLLANGDERVRRQLDDWNLGELILFKHSRPDLFDPDGLDVPDHNPYRTERRSICP